MDDRSHSVLSTLLDLFRNPEEMLLRRWNWKSSVFSSLCRGAIFFFANCQAGLNEATSAMLAEFVYRAFTAGFYGAMTQSFRFAKPRWLATATALLVIPAISHGIEFTLHWVRGTPNLAPSMIASVGFTILSTSFNLHAMRQGVLVVGRGGRPILADIQALPATVLSFVWPGSRRK